MAQDAFAEALYELRHWLQPLDSPDFVVNQLDKADLCRQFPEEGLAFLDVLVPKRTSWPIRQLKACLDAILKAQPDLETDDRFLRLFELLR